MKKIIYSLIASLALVLVTPFITQASPLVYTSERISGQDRVETALKISQKGWNSAQTVILCENSDYPDSIASTPFAVSLNAPILLTAGDSIDQRVVTELQRLGPNNVILLGGIACLKPSIEKELENLSFDWERIGGIDRYETSVLLAKRLTSDSLILANGDDFPDALSAATFAGINQIPIVLTSTSLPDSVIRYYKETAPQHLIVIGGEVVVPTNNLTKNNFTVETRLGGQDRYETNAKVVSFMKDTYASNDLFLASGITFPDAVAGTVLASKEKAPLLLTEKEDIPPSVYTLMREHMKVEPPAVSTTSGINDNSKKGITTASAGLNLRETPSSAGAILITIPLDTTIDLIDKQDQWYKTTYQSKTGWISADYVTLTTPNTTNIDLSVNGTVYILGGTGIISSNAQNIIQGKATSKNKDNLKDFPSLPSTITIPSRGDEIITPTPTTPDPTTPDPTTPDPTTPDPTTPDPTTPDPTTPDPTTPDPTTPDPTTPDPTTPDPTTPDPTTPDPTTPDPTTPDPTTPDPTTPDPTTPDPTTYDPSTEVLVNPFLGIPDNALAGRTIMLDPGHGGPDTGAVGPNNTYEKDNTLAIALALYNILKQAGAEVILTRDSDISPAEDYSESADLKARVDLANEVSPDLFISIHNDAFTNPNVQGSSTFYSKNSPKQTESIKLAKSIESSVIDTIKTNNRGVKEANFYVVRYTNMPSILLETAFISCPYEEARLQNPTFRNNVAAAIFHGIYNYYETP